MKRALAAATLVLVAGGLAGCGSDSDSDSSSDSSSSSSASAGTDESASADSGATGEASGEFCSAFEEFGTALSGLDPTAEDADVVKAIKDAVDKLSDVDLPSGIPDDAEAGFNKVVDAIKGLPDDASAEDLSNIQADFTEEDKANATAFNTYLAEECPELSGGASDSATDAPTVDPSASVPTESPS